MPSPTFRYEGQDLLQAIMPVGGVGVRNVCLRRIVLTPDGETLDVTIVRLERPLPQTIRQ